jgi:hypothetical protein
MIGIFERLSKRRAIRRYLSILSGQLAKDYGHRGPYTPAQVEAALSRHKAPSPRHWPYALAIFCDSVELERLRPEKTERPFNELRMEVASGYFSGADYFDVNDIARFAGEHGGGVGGAHSGDAAFHHGGGGHH